MSDQLATHRDLANVERRLDLRINGHEDLCGERYRNVERQLQSGDQARETMRQEMRNGFSGIYARLWMAAGSIIALEAAALGYFLIANGLPGAK